MPRAPEPVPSYGRVVGDATSDGEVRALRPWLQRIRELVDEDERTIAFQELEAFRQAYPDHPVDPDPREKLGLPVSR